MYIHTFTTAICPVKIDLASNVCCYSVLYNYNNYYCIYMYLYIISTVVIYITVPVCVIVVILLVIIIIIIISVLVYKKRNRKESKLLTNNYTATKIYFN